LYAAARPAAHIASEETLEQLFTHSITPLQEEPSAQAPSTKTTLRTPEWLVFSFPITALCNKSLLIDNYQTMFVRLRLYDL